MSFSLSGTGPLRWPIRGPLQAPGDILDYGYPASAETINGTDPLTGVDLSIAPSGTGEAQPISINVVNGSEVIAWIQGGIAGRLYRCKLVLTTEGGRRFDRLLYMPMDRTLMAFPVPIPPSTAFGPIVSWRLVQPWILGADGRPLLGSNAQPLIHPVGAA